MKKAVIICCVLTTMITTHAQVPVFKWVTGYGSNEFVYPSGIIADPNGNLYTLGIFQGTHDFDLGPGVFELTSQGSLDIFIVKTDPGGNFLWARAMGGRGEDVGYSIQRDVNGNIWISGQFQYTADLDPSPGVYNRTAESPQDMFVCKLDPSGNFLWTVTIPGLSIANFLATDGFGNVYVSGNFTGPVDFDPGPDSVSLTSDLKDIFILKLDASGNFQWVKQITSNRYNYVFDIAVDNSGNVFTIGDFQGTVDFDPGAGVFSLTANNQYDGYILKLDADGNFEWVVQFGGIGEDVGVTIAVDNSGNVYSSGFVSGTTVDFDPGPGVFNLVNTYGYAVPYIVKLDASGNLVWAKLIGGPESGVKDLAVNESGDVYVTGHFRETIDFDPNITSDDLTANETDMFLAKFDSDGTFEWSQQVTGPDLEYGIKLTVDEYENIFTTGVFLATADFDPGPGTHNMTASDRGDVYILKTGVCAKMPVSSLTEARCNSFTLNGHTYTTSGIYKQTIINQEGCDSTITLNLTITENIATSIAKSICQGESFEGYTVAGSYTDIYAASNGCDSIRTLALSVVNKPAPNLGEDLFICKGDSISLSPGQFDSYTWQDGSRQDRLLVREAGMYSVTVQAACGVATDAIIIKSGPCGVYFPTAFTPNNDGVNDIFTTPARNDFFSAYHLVVYNRWGQKIFESKDPARGWDGRVSGILQAAETFIWACTFTQRDNGVKDARHGTVTLLR